MSKHLFERCFGSFSRSFRLPFEVDHKKIEAKHKDGVLRLSLPKGDKEVTTKIKIKS
ncbi:MAG: Hsp20/alpha crystallin family protein [Desulfarculaceae bacterium]